MKRSPLLAILVTLACDGTTNPTPAPLELTIISPAFDAAADDQDSLLLLGEATADDVGLLPEDSVWWTWDGEIVATGRRAFVTVTAGPHSVSLHARHNSRSADSTRTLEVGIGLGQVLWTVPLAPANSGASYLAYDDSRETLIASDSGTRIAVAIDLTGTIRWSRAHGLLFQQAPPAIGPDGGLFYGMWSGPAAGTGGVLALNPDGTPRWSFFTADHAPPGSNWYHIHGGVAIDNVGNIYVATEEDDGPLYSIAPDGGLRWRSILGDRNSPEFRDWRFLSYTTLVADSLVFSLHRSELASAVRAGNGGLRWRVPAATFFNLVAAAIGADGTLYVPAAGPRLLAHRPDGTSAWDTPLPLDLRYGSPVVGNDRIYFAAANGGVTVLSLNGSIIDTWGPQPSEFFHDGLTLGANGVIYVAITDSLLSYDANGERRFAVPIPHAIGTGGSAKGGPVIGPDGTLYLHASGLGVVAFRDTVGPATDAPWPTLQGNFRRTGRRATDQ